MSNNKMERFKEEFQEKEKITRGLKKINSSLISYYKIFYNYVRYYYRLDGMTPQLAQK